MATEDIAASERHDDRFSHLIADVLPPSLSHEVPHHTKIGDIIEGTHRGWGSDVDKLNSEFAFASLCMLSVLYVCAPTKKQADAIYYANIEGAFLIAAERQPNMDRLPPELRLMLFVSLLLSNGTKHENKQWIAEIRYHSLLFCSFILLETIWKNRPIYGGALPGTYTSALKTDRPSAGYEKEAEQFYNKAIPGEPIFGMEAYQLYERKLSAVYAGLTTTEAFTVRPTYYTGIAAAAIGVALSSHVDAWVKHYHLSLSIISAAFAETPQQFLPPLGLPAWLFDAMIAISYFVVLVVIGLMVYLGFFRKEKKSTRAAFIVEHFLSFILGVVFGTGKSLL